MREHGTSGRTFAGRVLQVITGSSGLDDYEWGVTLFAVHPDDLKAVVYAMRFDRASAIFAEFGPFYAGMVTPVEEPRCTSSGLTRIWVFKRVLAVRGRRRRGRTTRIAGRRCRRSSIGPDAPSRSMLRPSRSALTQSV